MKYELNHMSVDY